MRLLKSICTLLTGLTLDIKTMKKFHLQKYRLRLLFRYIKNLNLCYVVEMLVLVQSMHPYNHYTFGQTGNNVDATYPDVNWQAGQTKSFRYTQYLPLTYATSPFILRRYGRLYRKYNTVRHIKRYVYRYKKKHMYTVIKKRLTELQIITHMRYI